MLEVSQHVPSRMYVYLIYFLNSVISSVSSGELSWPAMLCVCASCSSRVRLVIVLPCMVFLTLNLVKVIVYCSAKILSLITRIIGFIILVRYQNTLISASSLLFKNLCVSNVSMFNIIIICIAECSTRSRVRNRLGLPHHHHKHWHKSLIHLRYYGNSSDFSILLCTTPSKLN